MSIRREDTASKLKDFQTNSSWIPTTPAKLSSTNQQLICTNWQENSPPPANWLESERCSTANLVTQVNVSEPRTLAEDFPRETQFRTAPTCFPSISPANASRGSNSSQAGKAIINSHVSTDILSSFDTWQAGDTVNSSVFGEESYTHKFSTKDADLWTNISFGSLLALQHAGAKAAIENAVSHNYFTTSSTSASCFHPQTEGSRLKHALASTDNDATSSNSTSYFHPQIEGSQFTMSFRNSSLQEHGRFLGANVDAELKIPNFVTNGSSISSRHFINLNSPPRTITDAALKKNTSQFEPITPEKTNKAECRQESAMKDLTVDEVAAEKDNQTTMDGVMKLQEKKRTSHMLINQLCEATSTHLQENHKPDKGGTEEANLSKTPQQKTRKKKHRPKVIIEGQHKSTPKSSVGKPRTPQETTGVKRKYVRRNEASNRLGGGTNGTDLNIKRLNSMETSVGKSRYTRRKIIEKPEDNMDKGTTEITHVKGPRRTRKSCRRSLNFDSDGLVRDGSSSHCQSSNCESKSQAENFNAKDMKRNDMVASYELRGYMDQVQDYRSWPEEHTEIPLPSTNKDTLKNNHMFTDQIVCTRGKCQIVFSDVTHDKEVNTDQVSMNHNSQWTQKSPSNSICSSICLTPEIQVRGSKRQNVDITCYRNENGILYNSLQAHLPILSQNADEIGSTPGLHLPAICKKKRTEKGHNTVTSSMCFTASTSDNHVKHERHSLGDTCTKLFTSAINQGSCGARDHVTHLLMINDATDGTQNGRKVFKDLLALRPAQRIIKRRSKSPTHLRDLTSLLLPASPGKAATSSRIKHDIEILNEPHTCMEALVADTRSTLITKKQSNRSMLISSTEQNLYNPQKFATTSIGPPLALTWKIMSPVDSIIEQLNQLDLNAESNQPSEKNYNTFMAYRRYYQEHHALVPYHNSAAVVPFDTSFDQVRRRRPRPKVDLDDETTRVWKLLLENINSEGIEGTDEEKTKWWEEERRVFSGRADSFIARMHLVQGDRRFSPWKGSVLDSVVGVFLTQNVSDHLSSSAFMSLAAQYPIKSKIHPAEVHKERLGTQINEHCVLGSDVTFGLNKQILNQLICSEDRKLLHDFEDDGIREVSSDKSSGNLSDEFILKANCTHGPVMSREIFADKLINLIEDGKDTEDSLSSQNPEISSQNSADSPLAQTTQRCDSCLLSTIEEPKVGVKPNRFTSYTSIVKLIQMTSTVLDENQHARSESLPCNLQTRGHFSYPTFPAKTIASCNQPTLCHVPNLERKAIDFGLPRRNSKFSYTSSDKEISAAEVSELSSESACGTTFQKIRAVSFEKLENFSCPNAHSSNNGQIEINNKIVSHQTGKALAHNKLQGVSKDPTYPQNLMDATGSTSNIDNSKYSEQKEVNSNKNDLDNHPDYTDNVPKGKGGRARKEKENQVDWDHLRKQINTNGRARARTANTLDSVDWDAVRCADVNEIAQTIKERGMNNMLAERIKDFLNRLVRDHGSVDLEWLRDVPPDKAKKYLLSIRGLGLKSVECVRLLTLHHLAFPVDTNVGRIAVRLGWVPLQPLPESLQLHLLELYPMLESIQKYLWPRLCKLNQRTLYELHYQMITFGKVFCTKNKPNCNACPMRGECRHFASAFASARLALPSPQEKSIMSATENVTADQNAIRNLKTLQLSSPQANELDPKSGVSSCQPIIEEPPTPEPIIEVPSTPEPDQTKVTEHDIESAFSEDPDEIPTIQLNMEEFTHNLQTIIQRNTELQEGDMSKALVALTSEAASIPVPKLKNVSRLRTEHQVYELPDSHPLLEGMDEREPDDPSPYLLAIWTPGETMNSIEPPQRRCSSQEFQKLCSDETCSSCNSIRESSSQTVRGTLLIPCRTAMRGSFPLNGTYFQVNEVFSDHESSLSPINVPREWLWNLSRRTVYFGTSIPTIFKGLSTEGIQYCFWRGALSFMSVGKYFMTKLMHKLTR